MSDRMPARDPLVAFIAELREPVAVDPGAKRRLMDMVREDVLAIWRTDKVLEACGVPEAEMARVAEMMA